MSGIPRSRSLAALGLAVLSAVSVPSLATGDATGDARVPPVLATLALDRRRARVDERVRVTLSVGVPADAFAVTGDTPAVDGAELVPLGRREETRSVDGRPYRFTDSRYALFADRPGTLELAPLAFRATLPVSAGGPGSTRNPRIGASTDPLRVLVETAPTATGAPLPALAVTLSSRRADADREVRAGEPFTRHVRVDARGQRPGAIPPLPSPAVDGLRFYPEPARLEARVADDEPLASRIESTVIVASRAGRVTLPALTLEWWDIDARARRTASLPAESILVLPGTAPAPDWSRERSRYRLALVVAGALCALLAANVLLLRRRVPRTNVAGAARATAGAPSERTAWTALRRALRRDDAPAVRVALSRWRRSRREGADPRRPDDDPRLPVAPGRDGEALRTTLRALDEHLYGAGASTGTDLPTLGKALARARRRDRPARARRAPDGVRLYPDERADAGDA